MLSQGCQDKGVAALSELLEGPVLCLHHCKQPCVGVFTQSACRKMGLGCLSQQWCLGMRKQWQGHTREHVRVSFRAMTVCGGGGPWLWGPCCHQCRVHHPQ